MDDGYDGVDSGHWVNGGNGYGDNRVDDWVDGRRDNDADCSWWMGLYNGRRMDHCGRMVGDHGDDGNNGNVWGGRSNSHHAYSESNL